MICGRSPGQAGTWLLSNDYYTDIGIMVTVLHKTDAANLCDFERIGALLGTIAH
jgi:hypothetical protein